MSIYLFVVCCVVWFVPSFLVVVWLFSLVGTCFLLCDTGRDWWCTNMCWVRVCHVCPRARTDQHTGTQIDHTNARRQLSLTPDGWWVEWMDGWMNVRLIGWIEHGCVWSDWNCSSCDGLPSFALSFVLFLFLFCFSFVVRCLLGCSWRPTAQSLPSHHSCALQSVCLPVRSIDRSFRSFVW